MNEKKKSNLFSVKSMVFIAIFAALICVAAPFSIPMPGAVPISLATFAIYLAGGLLGGKIMCWVTKGKVNPLIGSAGVSAVPMAARVSQVVGQKEDPANFLLMHAMGPNVAGVIGSAVAAGVFLSRFA